MSRRPGNKKGMLKGLGRAIQRHLSAADERFGLRLGAGLDGTLVPRRRGHVRAASVARPRRLGAAA